MSWLTSASDSKGLGPVPARTYVWYAADIHMRPEPQIELFCVEGIVLF